MALRNQPTSLGGLPIQIDYTSRDFEAVRAELLNLATQLTPEWTDREAGDIGVTILEAVAYVADIISYQQDRVLNESYLGTAQTREAVTNLLALIGYQMAPASPATVNMVVQVDGQVTLPAGFKVSTLGTDGVEALEYELTVDVLLPSAGFYRVSTEASKFTRVFQQVGVDEDRLVFVAGESITEGIGASDGTADQLFPLTRSPICLSSNGYATISITVDGEIYTSRTTFLGAGANDAVFVYRITSDEEVLIRFGDGINGKIPPNGSSIIASYRINGGSAGNRAGIGTITQHDNVVGVVSVYNLNQPSGGSDPETILEAKKKGPRSIRALDRCVTLDDFESMALLTTGGSIRAARAAQGESPIDVNLYVAAQGSNPVPTGRWYPNVDAGYGDIGAVGRWISQKMPAPTRLTVLPPTVVNPYFKANIVVYPNLLRQTVEFDVDIALQALFAKVTDDFGENIPLSAVIQAIENTRGVDYVTAKAFHRIPQARFISGDRDAFDASTVTINNLSLSVKRRDYRIIWYTSGLYDVYAFGQNVALNEIHQQQGQVFRIIDYTYDSSGDITDQDHQLDLFIDTDAQLPPSAGDVWEFSVDEYLGNIITKPYEIVVAPTTADGRVDPNQINLTYLGGI